MSKEIIGFESVVNPDVLPAGDGNGTACSPDGQYMSVAHDLPPFITIYKRNGDTFTKLANPDVLPMALGVEQLVARWKLYECGA